MGLGRENQHGMKVKAPRAPERRPKRCLSRPLSLSARLSVFVSFSVLLCVSVSGVSLSLSLCLSLCLSPLSLFTFKSSLKHCFDEGTKKLMKVPKN